MTLKARFMTFLAIMFMSAQFLGVAHGAAYGDADHVHDGHPCIVASIVKKSSDIDVAPTLHLDLAEKGEWLEATPLESAPKSLPLRVGTIRAPPARA